MCSVTSVLYQCHVSFGAVFIIASKYDALIYEVVHKLVFHVKTNYFFTNHAVTWNVRMMWDQTVFKEKVCQAYLLIATERVLSVS